MPPVTEMTPEIVTASKADVRPLATTLARAFVDDPFFVWMFPDEGARMRRAARFFRMDLSVLMIPRGATWTDVDRRAAAVWAPPGTWKIRVVEQLRAAPTSVATLRRRTIRVLRGFGYLESAHPEEPHWYLATLGTDPDHQGEGRGSAVMRPVLERCDRDGLPAYLESSKASNIPFYERHGFEVTGEVVMPDGPRVWPMLREPRFA